MKLYKKLGIDLEHTNVISVVGGGGKTTTILTLAKELKKQGQKVLITTSTGIFIPEKDSYDNLFLMEIPESFMLKNGTITYFAQIDTGIKLKTKEISLIDHIISRSIFDTILIEADGSKAKPIKAPAEHEPVISKHTTITIGIIGLDCLGSPINEEYVHRPELILDILHENEEIINNSVIIKLAKDKNGLFKNSLGRKILILNKCNDASRIENATKIKKELEDTDIHTIMGDILTNKYLGD